MARVWGLRQSNRFQCTGVMPSTSGAAITCTRRRRGKPAMLTELVERGLISTRSASKSRWMVTLASNRPSRNPSCMNIRIPAKLMPARATARRTGWRVSNNHANGMRRARQRAANQAPGFTD